jgi:imidazolonepropionase-like amidohydrolase
MVTTPGHLPARFSHRVAGRDLVRENEPVNVRAVRGATLIDGTGQDPVRSATVLVEGNVITAVGPDSSVSIPSEAEIMDGRDLFLLPGLIDCHVHVMFEGFDIVRELGIPPSLGVLRCIPCLRATLEAGFTTVRDAGGAPLGVKMAIEQGIIVGPRMQISVTVLSQTGGHGDPLTRACIDLSAGMPDIPLGVVDGVEPMRRRVREILRAGAGWIKLCTTGGVLSQTDAPSASQFTVVARRSIRPFAVGSRKAYRGSMISRVLQSGPPRRLTFAQ